MKKMPNHYKNTPFHPKNSGILFRYTFGTINQHLNLSGLESKTSLTYE